MISLLICTVFLIRSIMLPKRKQKTSRKKSHFILKHHHHLVVDQLIQLQVQSTISKEDSDSVRITLLWLLRMSSSVVRSCVIIKTKSSPTDTNSDEGLSPVFCFTTNNSDIEQTPTLGHHEQGARNNDTQLDIMESASTDNSQNETRKK